MQKILFLPNDERTVFEIEFDRKPLARHLARAGFPDSVDRSYYAKKVARLDKARTEFILPS